MKSNIPKHIAIILDGNRRYAKKLKKMPWEGHNVGAKKVRELIDWCNALGIKELTLYAFSIENFNRPKREVNFLMKLFKKQLDDLERDERIDKNRICINFIGRLNLFPADIRGKMKRIVDKTKRYNMFKINFAMAYGGRAEIVDAAKNIAKKVKEGKLGINSINEDVFSKNLYISSEPDLLIRPGGEKRVSNFLIWQSNYSELVFMKKLWPEFTKRDLIQAINEYKKRNRRFGK